MSLLHPARDFLYRVFLQSLVLLVCSSRLWSLGQIKRMSGEQDIRVSYAGRWKAQVFITDNGRCTAAQWWGTDSDLLILKRLPTPSVFHLSLFVCLWCRRRFLTSVHLLPYWNQHLRHIGTQDGEVGREIILIYSLVSLSHCRCDICFLSSKWVFSVFSVWGWLYWSRTHRASSLE